MVKQAQEELTLLAERVDWKLKSSGLFGSVMDSGLKMSFSQHHRYRQTTWCSVGRKQMPQPRGIGHENNLGAVGRRDSGEICN